MIIFKTKRLHIKKIVRNDTKDLYKVLADPVVMKYSTIGVHSNEQVFEYVENCQKQYDLNGFGHWAIYDLDNEFIGLCGLNKNRVGESDVIHINYRITREHQGKGYAIESTLGVLDFAKNSLKLESIYALIEPENINSVKVVARSGFQFIEPSVFRNITIDVYKVSL